jgi:hypothetical protein
MPFSVSSFIYHIYLVPAAAACVRYSADDAGHCYLFTGVNVSFILYYLVPTAAACVRHPAAA